MGCREIESLHKGDIKLPSKEDKPISLKQHIEAGALFVAGGMIQLVKDNLSYHQPILTWQMMTDDDAAVSSHQMETEDFFISREMMC